MAVWQGKLRVVYHGTYGGKVCFSYALCMNDKLDLSYIAGIHSLNVKLISG